MHSIQKFFFFKKVFYLFGLCDLLLDTLIVKLGEKLNKIKTYNLGIHFPHIIVCFAICWCNISTNYIIFRIFPPPLFFFFSTFHA